jgi:hypothetical protein
MPSLKLPCMPAASHLAAAPTLLRCRAEEQNRIHRRGLLTPPPSLQNLSAYTVDAVLGRGGYGTTLLVHAGAAGHPVHHLCMKLVNGAFDFHFNGTAAVDCSAGMAGQEREMMAMTRASAYGANPLVVELLQGFLDEATSSYVMVMDYYRDGDMLGLIHPQVCSSACVVLGGACGAVLLVPVLCKGDAPDCRGVFLSVRQRSHGL